MQVTVQYQPTESKASSYWFNTLTGKRSELVFECEHENEIKSAPQNYMQLDGVHEVEEHWMECINCGKQWDMSGKVEL